MVAGNDFKTHLLAHHLQVISNNIRGGDQKKAPLRRGSSERGRVRLLPTTIGHSPVARHHFFPPNFRQNAGCALLLVSASRCCRYCAGFVCGGRDRGGREHMEI